MTKDRIKTEFGGGGIWRFNPGSLKLSNSIYGISLPDLYSSADYSTQQRYINQYIRLYLSFSINVIAECSYRESLHNQFVCLS